ncbi:alpha/beta fold hydrolase [Oerskovia enterophila]
MPESSRKVHARSADGTRISVTVTGSGQPLVVVPGSLSTAHDWQPVADLLAPSATTYAIDRQGRADSGSRPHHTLEREQEDLAAVLQLTGDHAIVVAHSYGGLVALNTLLDRPAAGLVLYEPPVPLNGPIGGEALTEFDDFVEAGRLDEAFESGLRNFLRLPDPAIEDFRRSPLWAPRAALTPTWGREVRAIDTFDADLTRFSTLNLPTMLLVGQDSPTPLVATSRLLAKSLPDAQLTELTGQAHDAYLTGTELIASHLSNFINSTLN